VAAFSLIVSVPTYTVFAPMVTAYMLLNKSNIGTPSDSYDVPAD
jgi:hypothetical protein